MFKVLNTDNAANTVSIQGAFSKNSNVDICRLAFQNFDADTNKVYTMAELVLRDQWGSSNLNGAGNLIIRTNQNGLSNLIERMRVQYDGNVGIGCVPLYNLDVQGSLNVRGGYCNLLVDSFSNGDIGKAPTVSALSNVYSMNIWTSNTLNIFSNSLYSIDTQGLANTTMDTSNSLVFLSNYVIPIATYASNTLTDFSNTIIPMAAFASNGLFNFSNFASPIATFASNTSVATSNSLGMFSNFVSPIASFGSNSFVTLSNFVTPLAAFGSNSGVFASNTSVATSNNLVSFSNFVTPIATFGSNSGLFASNSAVGTSNQLVTFSNFLSPIATFGSNTSFATSNNLVTFSNFVSSIAVFASNYFDTFSNLVFPGTWRYNGATLYTLTSNVGIGTDTPLEPLSVVGQFSLSNTSGKVILSSSNGNLGIATQTPISLLDVNGAVNVRSNLIVRNVIYNYGREFFYTSNTGLNSTTGTTYLTSTTLNTFVESGNYLFNVIYSTKASLNNRICMGRVYLSNSLTPSNFIHLASNVSFNTADVCTSDSILLTLPTGSNTFVLQYALSATAATVTIKDTVMSLLRIS